MRRATTLALSSIGLACALAFSFASLGACSSSVPVGVPGSIPVPAGDLPSDVPRSCLANQVYEAPSVSGLCGGTSPVYFVCDDDTYSQYVCSEPVTGCTYCPDFDAGTNASGDDSDDDDASESSASTAETSDGSSMESSEESSGASESVDASEPDAAVDDAGDDAGF